MLTPRGWSLGAVAILAGVAAGLFGIEELYAVAAAAIILIGVCAAWVHGRSWQLDARRHLSPARIAVGDSARVVLTVTNRSLHQSPVLTARDPFDDGQRRASFGIAPLRPGETRRAAYGVPGARRGVFSLGPLELTLADPFGLVAITRRTAKPSTLTVHPRVELVAAPRLSSGYERRSSDGSPRPSLGGDEFYAVREYRPGDDLRRVHWASTARLDELMIRQEEAINRGRLTVAVDLRSDRWSVDALEAALSAAASVVAAGIREGLRVRLIHTGRPTRRRFDTTATHVALLLDDLASAAPHSRRNPDGADPPLATRLGLATAPWTGGGLVVLVSDRISDADLVSLSRTGRTHRQLTIVIVATDPPTPARHLPPIAAGVIRCGGDRPFADAWQAANARLPTAPAHSLSGPPT